MVTNNAARGCTQLAVPDRCSGYPANDRAFDATLGKSGGRHRNKKKGCGYNKIFHLESPLSDNAKLASKFPDLLATGNSILKFH
jgi:hypothetical protein